jgi:hypothetical protein
LLLALALLDQISLKLGLIHFIFEIFICKPTIVWTLNQTLIFVQLQKIQNKSRQKTFLSLLKVFTKPASTNFKKCSTGLLGTLGNLDTKNNCKLIRIGSLLERITRLRSENFENNK